jgi:hypothetical protein
MNSVESLGLLLSQVNHPSSDDAQAMFFEPIDDVTNPILGDGARLDNRQGAFHGHTGLHSK